MSSASCYVSEIEQVMFGGTQARFWMYRKHFNFLPLSDIDDLPFYSWQCLTLCLAGREVNLVIHNEQHMSMFLKYLIHQTMTLDGKKNSGGPLLDLLNKQSLEQHLS